MGPALRRTRQLSLLLLTPWLWLSTGPPGGPLKLWGGMTAAAADSSTGTGSTRPPGLDNPALIYHPNMQLASDPSLPAWDQIIKQENRKTVHPGEAQLATSGSVTMPDHFGGLYDSAMAEHLRTGCDGSAGCRRKLCSMARGDWCKDYYAQTPVPWRPAPRGDVECPSTQHGECNGVGSCHHDLGVCLCPAGWRGDDCGTRDPRPCTHRYRNREDKDQGAPISHVGPDGGDLDWAEPGWTASRCAGWCDEDLATCYCPPNTTFGVQPAPPGSPPGTPPLRRGRPLGDSCKPKLDPKTGKKVDWGSTDPNDLFGPEGWCNSMQPRTHCGCILDGTNGATCELQSEQFCLNQCSGHGECNLGFCKCHKGWYGMDCSRKRASATELEKGYHEEDSPNFRRHLAGLVVSPPAAQDPPPAPTRRRPLIYVYDTDPIFNTKIMQYRIARSGCVYRLFGAHNDTTFNSYVYSLESYWIEMLQISQHRTFDPEEADFFFVPVQVTCYFWPVLGWADHPWFGMPAAHLRSQQGAYMYLKAKRWIQEKFPYWNRRGGRDHIWMMTNDEGACWMPTEVYNTSIVLSHWGRMDFHHVSGTAWGYDNYSQPIDSWPPHIEGDWRKVYDGHPCYTPGKDLIIPSLKPPEHYIKSPLLGHPPVKRDILLYMRGDMGPWRHMCYSRGIRQRLAKLAFKHDWATKYRIYIGENWQILGSYSEHLARSIFCVVAPGDGWSSRAEDAILHGCIPLVIMDGVHAVFESIIEWDAFAVRIKESAVTEQLPQVLLAFSPEQIERMQRRLATVWHRFAYATGPLMTSLMNGAYGFNRGARLPPPPGYNSTSELAAAAAISSFVHQGMLHNTTSVAESAAAVMAKGAGGGAGEEQEFVDRAPLGHPYKPYGRFPVRSDAWNTIMAWLHSRIPHTR